MCFVLWLISRSVTEFYIGTALANIVLWQLMLNFVAIWSLSRNVTVFYVIVMPCKPVQWSPNCLGNV